VTTDQPFLTVLPPGADDLAEKDRQTFDAICAEIEAIGSVREAREKSEKATGRVSALKQGHVAMNRHGKELFEHVTVTRDKLDAALVEQYAGSGEPVDVAPLLADLTAAQGEREALMRALARLVERLSPLAEIARLKAEADLFMGRSDHLKRIASERIAKTAELLREAAAFESGVVLDLRGSLSGYIQAAAESLTIRSVEAAGQAIEQERVYRRMNAPTL
jgi:hypothetical protein